MARKALSLRLDEAILDPVAKSRACSPMGAYHFCLPEPSGFIRMIWRVVPSAASGSNGEGIIAMVRT